ncbi:hypothetical protein, partial [Aeromonas jandaei]|uniref:hypothetical protein n=1 Tax=Aeromonas TaxID=642 RepID=UPI003BA2C791
QASMALLNVGFIFMLFPHLLKLAPDNTSHYALPFLLGNKLPTQAVRQSSLFSCQATLGERLR